MGTVTTSTDAGRAGLLPTPNPGEAGSLWPQILSLLDGGVAPEPICQGSVSLGA